MISGFVFTSGGYYIRIHGVEIDFNLAILDSNNQGDPIESFHFTITISQGDGSAPTNQNIIDTAIAIALQHEYTLLEANIMFTPYTGSL